MVNRRLAAEVLTRREPTTVEWEGAEVTLAPYNEWRASTVAAMRSGNFTVWASAVLDEASLEHWDEVDPTLDQVQELFSAWLESSGTDVGESAPSSPSSRATRKR